MKSIAMLVLSLAGLFGGDEKDKPRLELQLRPAVTVRGLEVTIGDLCDVTPAGAEALAYAQVTFGPSPVGGYARTVTRAEIVQAIATAGRDVAAVKIVGSKEVVVQTAVVDVPGGEVLESAATALQALLAVEGGDVEVEAPSRLRAVQAPPGRTSQELRARVRGGASGPTAAVVDVEVLVDGTAWKKVPVTFKLTRFQGVVRTLQTIRAGAPLGPDNLAVVREPVAPGTAIWVGDLQQVEGLVAARNLPANQRLTLGDMAPPAVVHRGDVVTVVLTKGRVKVTARAMANHDAPLGGRVTLTNLHSRSTLTGVVLGQGLVVVQS